MELVIILIVVAVLVVGGLGTTFLVLPRRRRVSAPPRPPVPGPEAGQTTAPPGQTRAPPADQAGEDGGGAPSAVLPPVAEPAPREAPPAPMRGRLTRLRGRLAASRGGFGSALLNLLSRDALDDQAWEDIEDTLITADMGVAPSRQITEELRTQVKVTGTRDPDQVRTMLRNELIREIGPDMDRTLHTGPRGGPPIMLVVGVNGTGKTTVVGKLSRALIGEGQTVVLGAADTFRAAAADQLDVGPPDRGQGSPVRPRGSRPGQRGLRGGPGRVRGAGGHRHRGHRRAAAHQDRPDG